MEKRGMCPKISIHASREGSDDLSRYGMDITTISIQASREGSDVAPDTARHRMLHFNPRFPRGKRQYWSP